MSNYLVTIIVSLFFSLSAYSRISPYIQNLTDNSVDILWESEDPNTKLFVTSENLNIITARPDILFTKYRLGKRPFKLYRAKLSNLPAGQKFFYEIKSKQEYSGLHRFTTLKSLNSPFSFLLMSDSQHGHILTKEIIDFSVLPYAFLQNERRGDYPIAFTLFPGDLVQWGFIHKLWDRQFFTPLKNILVRTPLIPAMGNHEYNSRLFWKYFYEGQSKPYYSYFDRLTSRFITLGSNFFQRRKSQLEWLELTLNNAKEKGINFIFVQFHHPAYSEVWPVGEKRYSRKIEKTLKKFSDNYEGHIIILNGHTHAYSRGHQPNHKITNIISGPLGGTIDYWKKTSKDYPHFMIVKSTPGWSKFDINEQSISFKYYSFSPTTKITSIEDEFHLNVTQDLPAPPKILSINKEDDIIKIDLENENYLSVQVELIDRKGTQTFNINERNDVNNEEVFNDLSKFQVPVNRKSKGKEIKVRFKARNKNLQWSKFTQYFIL